MLRKFSHIIVVPGTLSANVIAKYTVPSDCRIVHVSSVASNNSDGRFKIGNSSDDDCYLLYSNLGDSGTPAVLSAPTDFRNDAYPRISKGEVVVITIDYDGISGTAAQDVTLVLTYQEG